MASAAAVALGLAGFALVVWIVVLYNRLVALDNAVDRAWANVDVVLKQRADEVPNLVAAVQGYAAHERALIEDVTRARATLAGRAGVREKAEASATLDHDVPRLLAIAEAYPDLKADENFLALQRRLSSLEDILADRREFYNDSVAIFNTRIRELPDRFLADAMRLAPKEYFRAEGADRDAARLG